jgi:hypothetical protein
MATISKKDIVNKIADTTQAKKVVVKDIVQSFLDAKDRITRLIRILVN